MENKFIFKYLFIFSNNNDFLHEKIAIGFIKSNGLYEIFIVFYMFLSRKNKVKRPYIPYGIGKVEKDILSKPIL